jgi:hypothetical protein
MSRAKLDAVLIGNAAAALQGAPVTTDDFDFMVCPAKVTLPKLRAVARYVRGTLFRPFYPISNLYRLEDESGQLHVDFMPTIHGIRSFETLRSRSTLVDFDGVPLRVASLEDIIKSKRAAGRPKDRAVLPILTKVLDEKKRNQI